MGDADVAAHGVGLAAVENVQEAGQQVRDEALARPCRQDANEKPDKPVVDPVAGHGGVKRGELLRGLRVGLGAVLAAKK